MKELMLERQKLEQLKAEVNEMEFDALQRRFRRVNSTSLIPRVRERDKKNKAFIVCECIFLNEYGTHTHLFYITNKGNKWILIKFSKWALHIKKTCTPRIYVQNVQILWGGNDSHLFIQVLAHSACFTDWMNLFAKVKLLYIMYPSSATVISFLWV